MKKTGLHRLDTGFLVQMALVCIICLACLSAVAVAEDSGSAYRGTLSTVYGEGVWGPSIYDDDLRKLVDEYITEYHSTLMIFTQCFGGDMVDNFTDRPNTTVLSATMPGHKAYYGGYTDGASRELRPGSGRTSNDVHNAGIESKKYDEEPNSHGPVFSLEDTSSEGPIKSRHIIFFAGDPDKTEGRDYDTRQELYDNFSGKHNTTVLSVGGNPDSEGKGTDGWDYPGNYNGLKAALREIGQSMGPDEQFIMFVGDHGDRQKSYSDFDLGSGTTGLFTLNFSLGMLEDMTIDGETGDTGVTFQLDPGVQLPDGVKPGDLILELDESGATSDEPELIKLEYGESPTEFDAYRLFFPFTKAELVPYEDGEWPLTEQDLLPLEFSLKNNFNFQLQFDWVSSGTGSVPKQDGGGGGPDSGSAGPGPSSPSSSQVGHRGDKDIPVVQLSVVPVIGDAFVDGISVQVGGTADLSLLECFNVIHDVNGNGIDDSGDELIGSEIPLLKDVPILANFFSSRQLKSDDELIILVTANLVDPSGSSSVNTASQIHYINAVWPALFLFIPAISAGWRRRRRMAAGLLCLAVALSIGLAACGGGTSNVPSDNEGNFTFKVTNVAAREVGSGEPVNFDGLPLTGSTLTVAR